MSEQKDKYLKEVIATYTYAGVWVIASAGVIMFNKFILSVFGFPYPIALTIWHMLFCSVLSLLLVKLRVVKAPQMSWDTYGRCVVPIAACFSIVLILGNSAYIYLSVSFIQMLKAIMPVTVYIVGLILGNERYSLRTIIILCVVTSGVMIASYGELNFHMIGVMMQILSVCFESFRLSLVQILLQQKGIKLNPITSLYYVAPACLLFLLPVYFIYEYGTMKDDPTLNFNVWVLLGNGAVAFGLNMAVFLLIGKTSALTMNIAGVIKDWVLIFLSVAIFKSPISKLNIIGYGIAFIGVWQYNQQRLKQIKSKYNSSSKLDQQDTSSKIKQEALDKQAFIKRSQDQENDLEQNR